MPASDLPDATVTALLEIARVRYAFFRERFGREPEPDEPLLFDPEKDQPTEANHDDGRIQLVSAAMASNVDALLVLSFLGYKHPH